MKRLDFLKSHFKGPKYIPIKKVVLPGRVKCGGTEGGSWPPAFPPLAAKPRAIVGRMCSIADLA